jgi:hypothetical protein
MTWLTTTHQVPGVVLVLAALAIGSTVAVVMGQFHDLANQRWHQARGDACEASARARAAERPYRQRLAPSRRGIYGRLGPVCPPPTPLELARVICPFYEIPGEDRWMVRRRIHQEVAA